MTMPELSDDTPIYEWCFEFWSPVEEDWVDYGYWTLANDEQLALKHLMDDEDGQVEHLSTSLNTWTFEEFKKNQGIECISLIRDLE